MGNYIEEIREVIETVTNDAEYVEHREQHTAILPLNALRPTLTALKKSAFDFNQLLDVTAIDYADKHADYRFEIVYLLYSIEHKHRLCLKVRLSEDYPKIPTVCDIYESADWYERETYDMYGITFENHPDLRRFYMPEDFVHPETKESLYPLRKEFPLMGIEGSLPLPSRDGI